MGTGRMLYISDSVLVITCEKYREYIVKSEENYTSCINFLSTVISKPDDFCNKIQYKPYAFWKKEIDLTYHKEKPW
jgi:predicted nucleic acid-binding Zn finger protein